MVNHIVAFIPGFGEPYFAHKLEILQSNLDCLTRNHAREATITVFIRLFSAEFQDLIHTWIELFLKKRFPQVTFILHIQPELLGTFLASSASLLQSFPKATHWIWLLDDVRLASTVDVSLYFQLLEKQKLDILSPGMSAKSYSHDFMKASTGEEKVLRITNFVEIFCLFMTKDACRRMWALIPQDCKYLWGVDMLLYPYGGFRMGIVDGVEMTHYYSSKDGNPKTYKAMCAELQTVKRRYPENINFRFKTLELVPLP